MMALTTRSERWAIGAVVLVTILAVCALAVPSGEGVAAPAAPPTNTAEPTISGRAEQGRTLSAAPGSWTGTGSISFAYQWVRCGADGGRPVRQRHPAQVQRCAGTDLENPRALVAIERKDILAGTSDRDAPGRT